MQNASLLLVVTAANLAAADEAPPDSSSEARSVGPTASSEPVSRHLVYVELLGKGGEYGVGYELTITPRLAIGGAGSFAKVQDEQIVTGAAYLHAMILERRAHSLYAEIGGIVAHSRIPSPVSDWQGMSKTGTAGFLSIGYQHASRHLVLRGSFSAVEGLGGLAPMAGLSVGVRP